MLIAGWVAKQLYKIGIERIFLYPGGTIAPLVHACIDCGIKAEVFKNEQGAAYAALAYARVTGKPQVAMVTSGPGVTNVITPLADAFYDSTPLVVFTGQVGTGDLSSRKAVRQRGFQEVPTINLVKSVCKRATCMLTVTDVFKEVPESFHLASRNRQGPVVIDFPMDMQRHEISRENFTIEKLQSTSGIEFHSKDLKVLSEVVAAAAASKRPVLFLGHGALNAGMFDRYVEMANAIDAFVVTSFLGIGCYDKSDERHLGYVGHTGHLSANRAVFESDFVLVIGARLDVRQTGTLVDKFVPRGQVAWVDSDPDELENPRVTTRWKIEADAKEFCEKFTEQFQKRSTATDERWKEQILALKNEKYEDRPQERSTYVQPRPILEALGRLMKGSLVTVVTGVGCHQHWAARHLPYHPKLCRLLTSGGHGTMGYDLPSAIGAAMAEPDRRVLCVVGDGSFLMNIQEMASLHERNLDVKIVIFNNGRLGIVSQFQLITWGDDPTSGNFGVPDFVAISRGFGIPADSIEKADDIDVKLEWLWKNKGPALLNVLIDPSADVVPMLLAGQTMGEMWMGRNFGCH